MISIVLFRNVRNMMLNIGIKTRCLGVPRVTLWNINSVFQAWFSIKSFNWTFFPHLESGKYILYFGYLRTAHELKTWRFLFVVLLRKHFFRYQWTFDQSRVQFPLCSCDQNQNESVSVHIHLLLPTQSSAQLHHGHYTYEKAHLGQRLTAYWAKVPADQDQMFLLSIQYMSAPTFLSMYICHLPLAPWMHAICIGKFFLHWKFKGSVEPEHLQIKL